MNDKHESLHFIPLKSGNPLDGNHATTSSPPSWFFRCQQEEGRDPDLLVSIIQSNSVMAHSCLDNSSGWAGMARFIYFQ